jgi:Type VI secretion system, TssC, VipB
MSNDLNLNPNHKAVREKVRTQLKALSLPSLTKSLAAQLQMPILTAFATEKSEDVYKREVWLEEEESAPARKVLADKLDMLIDMLESSDDVAAAAAIEKQKIQQLKDTNIAEILNKSRELEKTWRELNLFYTNAAENELRSLTILNTHRKTDEEKLVVKVGGMLDKVNKSSFGQDKSYSFLVAPGFIGQSLIEKFRDIAFRNKALFLTDYKDDASVDEVAYTAEQITTRLGGLDKAWSRTVVYTNAGLLREQYAQEKRPLFGSAAAAVAGKLYSIDNIGQPVAGAVHGALSGLKGLRFEVNQEQTNVLDKFNLNPIADTFGGLMPMNVATMFKGDNVELRQYNVIRTLDYVDKVMKHFLNQNLFQSMMKESTRLNVHSQILRFLKRLKELDIIKEGRITHFATNKERPDRFDITLEVIPMFVVAAFEYKIAVGKEETNSDEEK